MREFMAVMKAMADESRCRALMSLSGRELCVCQITELLGLAPSTVSKHMAILKSARLVEARKEGRWIFYRIADHEATPEAKAAIVFLTARLAKEPGIREDCKRLEKILRTDPEELCRKQGRSES